MKKAKPLSPKKLLAKLKKKIGYVHLERSLCLPFGYLKTLEKKKMPKEDEALLRIVNLMPWILEVTDNNYDSANKILEREADKVLVKDNPWLRKGW